MATSAVVRRDSVELSQQRALAEQQTLEELEAQIISPQLQQQNAHGLEVFKELGSHFNIHFSSFNSKRDELVSFSKNLNKHNTKLSSTVTTDLSAWDELESQDVWNRRNYFNFKATVREVEAYAKLFLETANALSPGQSATQSETEEDNPVFFKQLVALNTLSSRRSEDAIKLSKRVEGLRDEMVKDLAGARECIVAYRRFLQIQGKHYGKTIPDKLERPSKKKVQRILCAPLASSKAEDQTAASTSRASAAVRDPAIAKED